MNRRDVHPAVLTARASLIERVTSLHGGADGQDVQPQTIEVLVQCLRKRWARGPVQIAALRRRGCVLECRC